MMDFITVPLITGIIVLGIYKLFELFVCRRERIMQLERSNELWPNKNMLQHYGFHLSFSTLKCGCLLLGIGIGLLLGYLICATTIPGFLEDKVAYYRLPSLVFGACVLLMGGLGLLTAFVIELKINKKPE